MLTEKLLNFFMMGAEWVLWLLVALSVVWMAVWIERMILYMATRDNIGELTQRVTQLMASNQLSDAEQHWIGDSYAQNVLRVGIRRMQGERISSERVEQAMLGEILRQKTRYELRLPILATIGNNAPFIGLFGTVLGIVQAFFQLGRMGATDQAANNQLVMSAIGEALVATGFGILVAIPAVAAFNWSKTLVAARAKEAESLMRTMLSEMREI